MKQLYATLELDLRADLPEGKYCNNCENYSRCSNTGTRVSSNQTFCKYSPSRFQDKEYSVQMEGESEFIILKID